MRRIIKAHGCQRMYVDIVPFLRNRFHSITKQLVHRVEVAAKIMMRRMIDDDIVYIVEKPLPFDRPKNGIPRKTFHRMVCELTTLRVSRRGSYAILNIVYGHICSSLRYAVFNMRKRLGNTLRRSDFNMRGDM